MNFDKDIAALESLFTKETYNYHNSASLQGKPWYGIGLEDNDSNTQVDDTNKKGIIKRMIDAIKAFIKRIVDKIKSFFKSIDKNKIKEDEAFVKTYKGPGDEAMVNAFADYVRNEEASNKRIDELAKKMKAGAEKWDKEGKKESDAFKADMVAIRKKTTELASKITASKEAQKKLGEELDKLFSKTGEVPTVEEVKEKIEETMVKKIQTKLTAHRMWMLLAMLDRTHHTIFTELLHIGDEITHSAGAKVDIEMVTADLAKAEEMSKLMQALYNETNEASAIEARQEEELLESLIAGDSEIASRSNLYFQQTYNSVMSATQYLEQLGKMQDSVYAGNDGIDTGETRRIQKLVKILAEYLALISRVSGIATSVSEILRGN